MAKLYALTPPDMELPSFLPHFKQALASQKIACMQIRLKNKSEQEIEKIARKLIPIAKQYKTPLLLNDNVRLAKKLTMDGVHIGKEDMPYKEARSILGTDAIIGVSCYASQDKGLEAAQAGADYIAFGSFFPSPTKPKAPPASLETLRWWQQMVTTPCVAIGGITLKNATTVIEAGADYLAVCHSLWQGDIGETISAFHKLCYSHSTNHEEKIP